MDSDEDLMYRPARNSKRARVDLHKLHIGSLQRYCELYNLVDALPMEDRDELVPAVARHFAQQVVDEDEALVNFAIALRKAGAPRSPDTSAGVKKTRNGAGKRQPSKPR